MKKRALILGCTGQDGSYLADILLERGYEVHGMYRRVSGGNFKNIDHISKSVEIPGNDLTLHQGDMLDIGSVEGIIQEVTPHEIYNEADQDNVDWSYRTPGLSCQITSTAVGNILEVVRKIDRDIKFFQPCTAMMFGNAQAPQDESTRFNPQSPYACAKAMAYHLARYYRNVHDMFVCTAILYNHDSPRRTEDYLLHKIAHSAVRMANGEQESLSLGNLTMKVDIGYAEEYMRAANDLMQLNEPDDFVIASDSSCTIDYLVRHAFYLVELPPETMDKVHIDPKFYRPGKTPTLVGDISKAKEAIGFNPQLDAPSMVQFLIDHIIKRKPTLLPMEEHQL